MTRRKLPEKHQIVPKLEHLLWFVTTVERGNAARASKKLKMLNTALIPAANRQLERDLQVKLFASRNVLTPAGQEFYKQAKKVLAAHRKLRKAMLPFAQDQVVRPRVIAHAERWLGIVMPNLKDLISPYFEVRRFAWHESSSEWYSCLFRKQKGIYITADAKVIQSARTQSVPLTILATLPVSLFGSDEDRYISGGWQNPFLGPCNAVAEVDNPVEMAYAIASGRGAGYLPRAWLPCEIAGQVPVLEENTGKFVEVAICGFAGSVQ